MERICRPRSALFAQNPSEPHYRLWAAAAGTRSVCSGGDAADAEVMGSPGSRWREIKVANSRPPLALAAASARTPFNMVPR